MIVRIVCLFALLCNPVVAAAQSGDENAACVPGNYKYEYTKKDAPCDKEKCMLHFPCEGQFAKGMCEAVGKCKATSVKICEPNTGTCEWSKPLQPTLPVASPPTGQPPMLTPISSGENPLSPDITGAFDDPKRAAEARVDAAAQRLQEAFDKLQNDPANYSQHFDEVKAAQDELARARKLESGAPLGLKDYIREFLAPKMTPTNELPDGTDAPIRMREWFNNLGSTFSDPDQFADSGTILNDGPPVQLLSGEALAREFELQRLERDAAATLALGYYPEQTDVERMIAEVQSEGRTPSEILGGAVTGAWDYLKSWFVPAPALELPEVPNAFEYVYSGNLDPNPASPFALDSRLGEFARPLTSPFDGLYDPGDWIGDFNPGEQVTSGNLSPDLREQITASIVDGGPQGIIDDKGRLWGLQEPGQPIVRIDSEEGRKISAALGCDGLCYESAAEEALATRTLPPNTPPVTPTLPESVPPASPPATPPAVPTTPPSQPIISPTAPPSIPPKSSPASPLLTSQVPTGGSSGGSSFFQGMNGFLTSIGQFLISLFGWFSNQPAAPAPPAPQQPQPPTPVATLTANPPEISRGQTSRLFWSSVNTDTCAIYLPSGATLISGTAMNGTATTSPLQTTTTFRLTCTNGIQHAESEATVIVE